MSRYAQKRIMKRFYSSKEQHVMWKGQDAGYTAKHDYARKYYKQNSCEDCGTTDNLHIANISGNYLRKPEDWKTLCAKCHYKFDINLHRNGIFRLGVSGYRGVKKNGSGWMSRISIDYKEVYLGQFKDIETAIMIRLAAEAQLL